MKEIKFGTDGWRAVIADQFTFANVELVSQAVADHLREKKIKDVLVAYDQRFLSTNFADRVAAVMAGNDIKVYLTESAVPTPVAAFIIKKVGIGAALMLTASHNPAYYHGLKYIPSYGGPALPEETDKIAQRVLYLQQHQSMVRLIEIEEAKRKGLLVSISPKQDYVDHLKKIINTEIISRFSPRIVIDPMYGAGIGYLEMFLSSLGLQVEALHNYRDPLFGGGLPDPSPKHLLELRERVIDCQADIGLALDGDADRMGAIADDGTYMGANQILPVIMEHLIASRGWDGAVARTVATTHLLDKIAVKKGLEVIETPVGFKYIGFALREQDAFLGGEESGGISIRGHVPEKDGILASLLLVEAMASNKLSLRQMFQDIQGQFGPLVSSRLDIACSPDVKKSVLDKILSWDKSRLEEKEVMQINRMDGLKIDFTNGSWCLVRPSGTENLFRIYAEAEDLEQVKQMQDQLAVELGLPVPAEAR